MNFTKLLLIPTLLLIPVFFSCAIIKLPDIPQKPDISKSDIIGKWEYVGLIEIFQGKNGTIWNPLKRPEGFSEYVKITRDSFYEFSQYKGRDCYEKSMEKYTFIDEEEKEG